MMLFHRRNYNDFIGERENMKIKKVQSVRLILACIAATGLIGCGKTDETSEKHEAVTFMAPYMDVDSFIEEVLKPIRRLNWKLFRTAEQTQLSI